jgi:hypothetical protein
VADKFDPYREALVIETTTVWPEECAQIEPSKRRQIEEKLHADPAHCSNLEYIRVHTGFCRKITVTAEDVDRLST